MNLTQHKQHFSNDEYITYYLSDNLGSASECFIFISGWGTPSSLLDMYSLATNLSNTSAIVIIERFGQGKSTMTSTERSTDAIIDELQIVIAEVKKIFAGAITLVGHSLGGLLVFEYAKKFQDTSKIILLDAVAPTNRFGKSVYLVNFIPAYFFIFLRKTGLVKKIPTSKLLEAEAIDDPSGIPQEIIDEAIVAFKQNCYNKNCRRELFSMIQSINHIYDNVERLKTVEIISIVRDFSYSMGCSMQEKLKLMGVTMKVVNLGKTSHFLHNEYTEKVQSIILGE